MKLPIAGFVLFAFGVLIGSASASTLVDVRVNGTIVGASPFPPTSNSGPYTPAQIAAQNAALSPFVSGHAYSATFSVDLDSPYTPNSGSANFEGSISNFRFTVPQSGFLFASNRTVNSGVSITRDSPGGDVIYFYLPSVAIPQSGSIGMLASVYFVDPAGSLNAAPSLRGLYSTFDLQRYSVATGSSWIMASGCPPSYCGSVQFSVTSVSVVPEPAGIALMMAGLAIVLGASRIRSKSRQQS